MRLSLFRFFVWILLGFGVNAWAQSPLVFGSVKTQSLQQSHQFEGEVFSENGEALEGINLFFPDLNKGTATDRLGRFSISLPPGEHLLRIEGLGFQPLQIQLGLYRDAQHRVVLTEQTEELDEVVVRNQENQNVESEMLGKSSLSLMETKNIPWFWGNRISSKQRPFYPGFLPQVKQQQALMCEEVRPTKT